MKSLAALTTLSALVVANLDQIAERIPAPEVQKFRDALQESTAALAEDTAEGAGAPVGAAGGLDDPYMPPFVRQLLDRVHAELDRKAEADNTAAAIADRTARALESIAESIKPTAPASGA